MRTDKTSINVSTNTVTRIKTKQERDDLIIVLTFFKFKTLHQEKIFSKSRLAENCFNELCNSAINKRNNTCSLCEAS